MCTAATVAVANTLAAKLGTVGAVTFLHLLVAPLAVGFIAYKVKCLVGDLGRSISKGVREDLEGKFRSITQAVIEGMKNELCDMDGMASAIVGEIITLDGWEKFFENVDTSDHCIIALNSAVNTDESYLSGIRDMIKAQADIVEDEVLPAHQTDFVYCVCLENLGPLDEYEQNTCTHVNECLNKREKEFTHCWVCLASLMNMNEQTMSEHLNMCLDRVDGSSRSDAVSIMWTLGMLHFISAV